MAAESSNLTWLDHHPWGGRLAFLILGASASLFIRSGIVNYEHEAEVRAATTAQVRAADRHIIRKALGEVTGSKASTPSPDRLAPKPPG